MSIAARLAGRAAPTGRRELASRRIVVVFAMAVALVFNAAAVAQPVGQPGYPDAPNPAAAAMPSTKRTPGELLDRSVRDAAHGDIGAALKDDETALHRGPLLIHGNYCGVGNRPGTPPVDLLDAACMRHDACTKTNTLPTCACDDHLRIDATAIAHDPDTPPAIRVMASAVAASMAVLVCR